MRVKDAYQARWFALLKDQQVSQQLKYNAFQALQHHYGEPHRFYHTFEHIQTCLNHLDLVRENVKKADILELALWFHDVIYQVDTDNASMNEVYSAEYAAEQLAQLGFSVTFQQQVYHLILLTQHPSQPKTQDEQFLIDIDLSILGAKATYFSAYEANIRQEYAAINSLIYRQGRYKVLQGFIQQPRLYQSSYFFKNKEQQARKNLADALQRLL
ncbi:MAG: hypothetical protein KAG28_02740 [Cocleimonas sp.]|nr:hypothetical protein [Cocleimonas sp.]